MLKPLKRAFSMVNIIIDELFILILVFLIEVCQKCPPTKKKTESKRDSVKSVCKFICILSDILRSLKEQKNIHEKQTVLSKENTSRLKQEFSSCFLALQHVMSCLYF